MIGELRTIARIIELFHIPLQHDVEQLRDVYLEVSRSCGYDNFTRQPGGALLESAASEGGMVSRVSFQKDRITFQEEHGKTSLESFQPRLDEVIHIATERLSIPIFILRNITVRGVAAAPGGRSAAQFLAEAMFRVAAEDLAPLGRPAQLIGFRLQLPATDQKSGLHQARIETYLRDARALYVEDVATFKFPIPSRDKERIAAELREVDACVHDRIAAFLNQFPRV